MKATTSGEKMELHQRLDILGHQNVRLGKRMDDLYNNRQALLLRFQSIKSLNIRFRKQHSEIKGLLYQHSEKDYDFLHDEAYELERTTLADSLTNIYEPPSGMGWLHELNSDQLLEEEELFVKIEEMVDNREKMLTLREEFVAQEEAANVRIEKLLKVIGN